MSKTYRNTPYKKMTQGYPIVKNKKNKRKMGLSEALNEMSEHTGASWDNEHLTYEELLGEEVTYVSDEQYDELQQLMERPAQSTETLKNLMRG